MGTIAGPGLPAEGRRTASRTLGLHTPDLPQVGRLSNQQKRRPAQDGAGACYEDHFELSPGLSLTTLREMVNDPRRQEERANTAAGIFDRP